MACLYLCMYISEALKIISNLVCTVSTVKCLLLEIMVNTVLCSSLTVTNQLTMHFGVRAMPMHALTV